MNIQAMRIPSKHLTAMLGQYQLILTTIFGILFLLASNVFFISDAHAAKCGAKGQQACKVTFKRLKACNKGLHKQWNTKKCVSNKNFIPSKIRDRLPEKQKNCGKLNEDACKMTPTRPKICDFGLKSKKGICVRTNVGQLYDKHMKQENCGKLNQYACNIRPNRLKACDFGLKKDKKTEKCRKYKSLIPPKQKNCGKYGQKGCKLTITRLKACDFGLIKDKKKGKCRKYKSILPPKPINCGKLNQKACKITLRRPKMCDFGLHRDSKTGRCTSNKPWLKSKKTLNCGKDGQRVCTIQEQIPGCNLGLKIDFKLKRCVYK